MKLNWNGLIHEFKLFIFYNKKREIYFRQSNGLNIRRDWNIRDILEKMDIMDVGGKKIAISSS